MGRRRDGLLLQGEVAELPQRDLLEEPLPHAGREKAVGQRHRSHHDTSLKLVQKPATEGQDAAELQPVSTGSIYPYFLDKVFSLC